MDVCVVGAGILGAAATYHLAARGARVTVLDATFEPRGASAATFGWINANGKQPDHYFELNRAGMEAHQELSRALRDASWLHGGGSIEWAADGDGAAALCARVEDHATRGYEAEVIDRTRLRELEPALHSPPGSSEVAYFSSEGWVDSVALIGLLLSSAREMGALVQRGVRANRLQLGTDGRLAVFADSGEQFAADVVVNCAGADAGALAASVGLQISTTGPVGLNAVTAQTQVALGRVVRAPGLHFRPETGGRLMIASPSTDATLAVGDDAHEMAERLVEAASQHLPGIAGAAVGEARVARRAIPPDGLPIVGRLASAPRLYNLVTHSGVTLAPLLGRLAAEEIVTDNEDARLKPYRPHRFVPSVIS